MAENMQIKVSMQAIDKFTAPLKNITKQVGGIHLKGKRIKMPKREMKYWKP